MQASENAEGIHSFLGELARAPLQRNLHQGLENLVIVAQPRGGNTAAAGVILLDDILQSMIQCTESLEGLVSLSVVFQRDLFGDLRADLATDCGLRRLDGAKLGLFKAATVNWWTFREGKPRVYNSRGRNSHPREKRPVSSCSRQTQWSRNPSPDTRIGCTSSRLEIQVFCVSQNPSRRVKRLVCVNIRNLTLVFIVATEVGLAISGLPIREVNKIPDTKHLAIGVVEVVFVRGRRKRFATARGLGRRHFRIWDLYVDNLLAGGHSGPRRVVFGSLERVKRRKR